MTDTTPTSAPTPWWELSGMEREIAKYDQCEEPGDCDHDHDNAIEYFREQELNGLRERAEKAEAEVARLQAQMTAEPAPFRFGEISDEELAAAEEAFTAAWAESKDKPLRVYQPAHTFVSQWSVRYLEDGIVSEKHHTEAEARQRAKANPRTMALVTRLVESEWREVGGGDA